MTFSIPHPPFPSKVKGRADANDIYIAHGLL